MANDRNDLQIIEPDECLELLATTSIGRIAVNINALPCVLPVHFVVHDGEILIRSEDGTKLSAALRNAVVAFEVDDFEDDGRSGWSVLVRGRSRVLIDPAEIHFVDALDLPPWATCRPHRFVAIETAIVSGRRLSPHLLDLDADSPGN